MNLCLVANCCYVAESTISGFDFEVCALHDHPATKAILEAGRRPGAYWSKSGFPMVIPCGALDDADFEPKPGGPDAIKAEDCPLVARIPDGPADCFEGYDLTRGV